MVPCSSRPSRTCTRPQELLNSRHETAGTADSPAVEILLNEVPLIGLVSGLPAQYGVELGRFGFLMTQDGLL